MIAGRRVPISLLALTLVLGACVRGEQDGGRLGSPDGGRQDGGVASSEATSESAGCHEYTLVGQVRLDSVAARVRPTSDARVIARFDRVNPQGAGQVFPLVDETYHQGRVWYRALLPIRPNGTTGWIPDSAIRVGRSDFRLKIDLDRLRLVLFERCERLVTYPIGIGTEDTPTPEGTFFLNSLLRPPERGSVYGAFAFGLSAYSDVITTWEGGGIVGLHGTNDPSSIGERASHGCIRVQNAAIRHLAKTVPLGTLIEIG